MNKSIGEKPARVMEQIQSPSAVESTRTEKDVSRETIHDGKLQVFKKMKEIYTDRLREADILLHTPLSTFGFEFNEEEVNKTNTVIAEYVDLIKNEISILEKSDLDKKYIEARLVGLMEELKSVENVVKENSLYAQNAILREIYEGKRDVGQYGRETRKMVFIKEIFPRLRYAKAKDYREWLKGYVSIGGTPTHNQGSMKISMKGEFGYDRRAWFVAKEDFRLIPYNNAGLSSALLSIIVPKGVRFLGGELVNCELYFMNGYVYRTVNHEIQIYNNTHP